MSDISKIKVGETTYDIKDQVGRDAFANSKIETVSSTSDNDHIPTAKAVYSYGQAIKNDITGAMVTTINSASDNEHYPSARAVYNYVQANAGSGGNSGGTDSGNSVASGFNLAEYYAVNTIQVIPGMIPDDADEFEGLRRVSDYTNKDVLFHAQAIVGEEDISTTGYLVNSSAGLGFPFPVYTLANEFGLVLLPEDTIFQKEVQDPETGTTTTEEVNLSAGIYCSPNISMVISCLEKKEKYLVQETISVNKDVTPVLNHFFKSSDNIDIDGLYSVLAVADLTTQGDSTPLFLGYASGGYFKPISPALPTIYVLEGSLYPDSFASIIATEETVIPEEFYGVAFTVEAGTYLYFAEDVSYLEMVKLQEKELSLDIERFLGQNENGLTILEALLFGLTQSETGEFNLTFNGNVQEEEKNIKKIYDFFRTAYSKNGQVIINLEREQGNIVFKMRTHLIKFGEAFIATVSGSLYDGVWLDTTLQVTAFSSGINVNAKVKLTQTGVI